MPETANITRSYTTARDTIRGGRGIGRVTFLIASQIQTVLGFTRRNPDGSFAACGMTVLRAKQENDDFRSTHAYLAEDTHKSIYKLHNSPDFFREFQAAFDLAGYAGRYTSGFALAIPYPHPELNRDGILAAAIEHFAPAVMNNSLVVSVNGKRLDSNTIHQIAAEVHPSIRSESIRQDVARYLRLIECGLSGELTALSVLNLKPPFDGQRDSDVVKKLRSELLKSAPVGIRLEFLLKLDKKTVPVSARAVVARPPSEHLPIDRFFREGMSLPEVKTKAPSDLDLIVLVDDTVLATYLNFCEGKAHLDLLESKETKAKLEDGGFESNFRVKRFVKSLPSELRNLLAPDVSQPDSKVFDEFFSIPHEGQGDGVGKGKTPKPAPITTKPLPPQRISAFIVETLQDGFRARANPKYQSWPVNVSVTMAYANGSRSLSWSEFDFRPSDLKVFSEGCEVEFSKNRLQATRCGAGTRIEVTGFDTNRELETQLRIWTHAAAN